MQEQAQLKLLPFQQESVSDILDNKLPGYNCTLLLDEMGLGKTIQCIAVIKELLEQHPDSSYLIICPPCVKYWWRDNIEKYIPDARVKNILKKSDVLNPEYNVFIISYSIVWSTAFTHSVSYFGIKFKLTVVDEAQKIQTETAKQSKATKSLCLYHSENAILVSGTPFTTKPINLLNLIKTVGKMNLLEPYDSDNKFLKRYCGWTGRFVFKYGSYMKEFVRPSNIRELGNKLRPIVIRREFEEVMPQLPPKTFKIINLGKIRLKKEIKLISDKFSQLDADELRTLVGKLNPDVLRLRRELAIEKFPASLTYILDILESIDKVVIFVHHRVISDMLVKELNKKYISNVVYDGRTTAKEKENAVKQFQEDETLRVFIGQLQSASTGITLTAAHTIIFLELSWSPAELMQASSRCHRIGQKSSVSCHFLVADKDLDYLMISTVIRRQDNLEQFFDR